MLDLFKRNYNREKIEFKIAKFFKLYDLSRDEQIVELQKKLCTVKKNNLRMKSAKANDFAEKSEIENLFLDSVEEWKKEILRRTSMKYDGAETTNYDLSQVMIEKLVSNKELLITFFEEMFGSGGFVGSAISSLEHHMRNKKYSLVQADMQHSYYSSATTKENYTSDEYAS